jgi:hypothetical protein
MQSFLIDRLIQEAGLYVYNMHIIFEKHFNISKTHVRVQFGSLDKNKTQMANVLVI